MKILYITQWYEPEPAFKGQRFAKALESKGDIVDVVTAFPNYPGGKVYDGYKIKFWQREIIDGICVTRLPIYPSHDKYAFGRMFNYISFFCTVLLFGLIKGHNYDAVYVYHPPITPSAAAAIFCWIHRKPLIVDIQDLWPDSVVASKMGGGRYERFLSYICNFVYRRAAHIICQSDGMVARLLERDVPKSKISRQYNWSTYEPARSLETFIPDRIKNTFVNKINIVYGGNLGEAQELTVAIDAAILAAKATPSLCLHLIGGGIDRERLINYVLQNNGTANILVHDPVDRITMDRVFDNADILLLNLRDEPLFEITIPSKLQHYLSCGKPIVAGLSGEAAALIIASNAGLVTPPGDWEAMAASIRELCRFSDEERHTMGKMGRNYYHENMSFNVAVLSTIQKIYKLKRPFF